MQSLSIRLLPFLLVAFLAIYVADSQAKSCKAKSHKTVAKHADKQATTSHKSSHHKNTSKSSSSSSHHSSGSSKKAHTTPSKGKAGVAGGQSLKWTGKDLAWFYDWSPTPSASGDSGVEAASMLWGLGYTSGGDNSGDHDSERLAAFKKVKVGSYKYVMGFNEPDFQGGGSSGYIDPKEAAAKWDELIAPHGHAGATLISPSCAKQKDETWMKPFLKAVKTQPDAIAVHIFQNEASKIGPVLDHYAQYNKPMWVTEFACINYQNGAHETCSQSETDTFISKAVDMFEGDSRVAAYSVSDAYNGPYSALTPNHDGQKLSQTGNTFKQAVAKFANNSRRRTLDAIDQSARMARRSVAHRRHAAHVAAEQDEE